MVLCKNHQCIGGYIMNVETLAKILHEAGREAVLKNKVVKKDGAPLGQIKFLEWNELTVDAQEGRRIQARYILDQCLVFSYQETYGMNKQKIQELGLENMSLTIPGAWYKQ